MSSHALASAPAGVREDGSRYSSGERQSAGFLLLGTGAADFRGSQEQIDALTSR